MDGAWKNLPVKKMQMSREIEVLWLGLLILASTAQLG
jgi:hypothetical protein